jgi:hypothetical protein
MMNAMRCVMSMRSESTEYEFIPAETGNDYYRLLYNILLFVPFLVPVHVIMNKYFLEQKTH